MWSYNYTDELYHYGVLGMKWGVHKALKKDSSYQKAKKQYNKDFNEAAKAARKTKSIAITNNGKAKKAALDKDYADKFDRMQKSAEKLKTIENNVKSKVEKDYKNARKSKDNFQKANNIVKTRRIAIGSKIGAEVLKNIGQQQYNTYKDNSSPGRTTIIRGLGYTSKVLNTIGNAAFVTTAVNQYKYGKNYWKD